MEESCAKSVRLRWLLRNLKAALSSCEGENASLAGAVIVASYLARITAYPAELIREVDDAGIVTQATRMCEAAGSVIAEHAGDTISLSECRELGEKLAWGTTDQDAHSWAEYVLFLAQLVGFLERFEASLILRDEINEFVSGVSLLVETFPEKFVTLHRVFADREDHEYVEGLPRSARGFLESCRRTVPLALIDQTA